LFCFTPAYAITASLTFFSGNFDSVRLRFQFGRESLQAFPHLVMFEMFGELAGMKRPHTQLSGGLILRRWHGVPRVWSGGVPAPLRRRHPDGAGPAMAPWSARSGALSTVSWGAPSGQPNTAPNNPCRQSKRHSRASGDLLTCLRALLAGRLTAVLGRPS
jgi:hypothetical protein